MKRVTKADLEKQVKELENQLSNVNKEELNSLKTELKEIKSERTKLRKDLRLVKSENKELSSKLENVNSELANTIITYEDNVDLIEHYLYPKTNVFVQFKNWMNRLFNGFEFDYYNKPVTLEHNMIMYYSVWIILAIIMFFCSIGISNLLPSSSITIWIPLSLFSISYTALYGYVNDWWVKLFKMIKNI